MYCVMITFCYVQTRTAANLEQEVTSCMPNGQLQNTNIEWYMNSVNYDPVTFLPDAIMKDLSTKSKVCVTVYY